MTYAISFTYDQIESLKSGELTRFCEPVRKSEDMPESVLRGEFDADLRPEIWRYGKREVYVGKWLVVACGGRARGEVLVRNIRRRKLQDMNSHDAQALGFYTVEEYAAYWDSEHKHKPFKWAANPDVWVIEVVYHTRVFTTAPLSPDALAPDRA